MKVLITGSSGLIGSEAVSYFDLAGHEVVGVDNNMRKQFFGEKGDTTWNLERLRKSTKRFVHTDLDIRDRARILDLFKQSRFELVIHCAAQPSHDKARDIPLVDFDVNAVGTINLLEAVRLTNPEAVFIYMSTNKVYGDAPNRIPLVELPTRYDYASPDFHEGIDESLSIDQCLHSIFGASKTAGDIICQEYGRYYGMNVGIFRGGCLTGPSHSGVELHGYLSYLIYVAVNNLPYTVYGYKGKQVRDQIHSFDVIRAFEEFAKNPRSGEVYNLGGGRSNSISIVETFEMLNELTNQPVKSSYAEENRMGDHICYITDMQKFRSHYPEWNITRSLKDIISEMIALQRKQEPIPL